MPSNHFKNANTLVLNGQLKEAVDSYRLAIRENPDFYIYYENLANALAEMGDVEAAIIAYRDAISVNSKAVWSLYSLGKLLSERGSCEEGVLYLEKAIAIHPESFHYNSLGIALGKLGRSGEAEVALQKALDMGSSCFDAYLQLAQLKSRQKLWSEALVFYRQAVSHRPSADGYFGMGKVFMELSQWEDAIASYRSGIGLNPTVAEAYYDLGMILGKLGRWEDAVLEYQKARNIAPHSLDINLQLGEILQRLGKLSEAESCYRRCLQIEPQQVEVQKRLEALSLLSRQAKTSGQSKEQKKTQSSLLSRQVKTYGQSEEQKKTQSSFSVELEVGEKIVKQAQAHLRKQEYDQAIAQCSSLLNGCPIFKDVFPLLAEAFIKRGKSLEGNNFLQVVQDVRRLIAIPNVQKIWGKTIADLTDSMINDKLNGISPSKVNTIVILTCVWKRPELTRVVLSYYSILKRELSGSIELKLLAVGSEGKQSRQLCESCGFDYVEYQNQPLSDKWEYGINRCRDYNPDAVIIVGSDDLISQSLIEFYDRKLKEGLVFCGITDAYFFDLQTEKMIHWVGYTSQVDAVRLGETTGMGRCLSKPLLERLDFSIWRNLNKDRNLDGAMTQKLYQVGLELLDEEHSVLAQVGDCTLKVGHCGFKLADINAMAVDIKFAENLTNFHRYGKWNSNSIVPQLNSWNLIEKNFPHPIIDQLKELILTTRKILHIEESQEFTVPPSSNILELSEGDQSFLEQVISVNSLQANETFSEIIFHSFKNLKSPNNQDFQQGIDLLKRSKYEDALKLFEKLVEQDSHYIFYYYLGECLSELGKWKEAVDAYQEANNLNPKFVNSYAKCGDVFMKLGQWDNAKNQFYQAVCALL
ncbi:tetratricopeptide repeat protein [Lyngbya sp. CCY1209]|uniref:tetratricopeptide repeat protein n=1 Tax=Lyngbya sp. CCY1209 TaxID=2886103 RepID=UPI002D20496B|nr:tetratricopeptide repeat protein [Lyngbya sp. CCY1209]MEB3884953.1 tetratricopeptide repeat protein [Lyngbya sp. CCY1209]